MEVKTESSILSCAIIALARTITREISLALHNSFNRVRRETNRLPQI